MACLSAGCTRLGIGLRHARMGRTVNARFASLLTLLASFVSFRLLMMGRTEKVARVREVAMVVNIAAGMRKSI